MNLLHVIASVDPRGGGPIQAVNMLSAVWSQLGHTCHIASLDDPTASWVEDSPVPVTALGSSDGWLSRRYGYSRALKPWLAEHAPNYDAVIVHGLWNYASWGAWRGLHSGTTPYYVYPHGMLDPWFNREYRVKTALKSAFWLLFERKVLRDARGVLFTATVERDLAQTSFRPYAARPFVVGLGTRENQGDPETQMSAFRGALPQFQGRRFILFLGRLHPKKGVDILIESFARHAAQADDCDLVIAGPDQVGVQRDLEALADRLGVARRIHWPGMITGEVKWGALRAASFFALTSHQENFGIAVVEALSVGAPVLVSNKVNIYRELEEDGAAIIVDDTLESAAAGLSRAMRMDEAQRGAMSERARQCFEQRFDVRAVADKTLRLFYQDLTIPPPLGATAASVTVVETPPV